MLRYLLLLALCCPAAFALDQESRLQGAADLYQQGKFIESAQQYIEALPSEASNASLYHNLALALDKSQNRGAAIAAYLRAVQLDPQDPDFRYNLRFLLERTEDRLSSDLPGHGIPALVRSLPERAIVYPSCLLFLIAAGLLIANNLRASRNLLMSVAGFTVLAASVLGLSMAVVKRLKELDPGAVGVAAAKVYAGPNEAQAILDLHEGAPVQILERNGDWVKIELADRKSGWMKKDDLVAFGHKNQIFPNLRAGPSGDT